MSAQSEELKARAMSFAINVLRFVDRFPSSSGAQIVGRQLAKSATSQGANYRASCTARSRSEFIAKLGVVSEEADECVYWLEVLERTSYAPVTETRLLRQEAVELRAIFGRSLSTARKNLRERQSSPMNRQCPSNRGVAK